MCENSDQHFSSDAGYILGRGFVARRNNAARSMVDVSPVLVMPLEDVDAIKATGLFRYT